MTTRRAFTAAACAALLAPVLTAITPAAATPPSDASTLATCYLRTASISDGGFRVTRQVDGRGSGGSPQLGPRLYGNDEAGLTTSWGFEPVVPAGNQYRTYVTLNGSLYRSGYTSDGDGGVTPGSISRTKVGGGWNPYRYIEQSEYWEGGMARRNHRHQFYGLVGDEVQRWTVTGKGWVAKARFGGYKAVKTMVLISQQRDYDTFLANTRGGALYTIRIPLKGAPVVKIVRARTWQGFSTMLANRCGKQSTLLLGINAGTGSGYAFSIGRATGRSTVINSLGKVDASFPSDPTSREYLDNEYTQMLNGD